MKWPCIYCRRSDVPRTREHVLQAAFGAVATLPTQVCAECNSAFSPIDKDFLEAVQFFHTGENMLRGLGLGRAVLSDGTSVNARLGSDGSGVFPPQLHDATATEWKFLGHREADLHQMLRELAEPASLQIKSEVVPAAAGVPRLAVLRSAPSVYLVQGTEAEAVARFAERIGTEGMKADRAGDPVEQPNTTNPGITFSTALHLDSFCRAMAKVALNFVCHRVGPEGALLAEFDRVRRYARYGEGSFIDFAVPTLLNHSLEDAAVAFVLPAHHALHFVATSSHDGPREAVFIVLKGKTVGRVDLTRGRPGLPQGTWLLTRFDAASRSFEDLTFPNDMPRAVLNPAALGLQGIWPTEGFR